jgi:hypothetical protein
MMVVRLLLAAAAVVGLTGCISSQVEASRADRECREMGAQPGTELFIRCRLARQEQLAADRRDFKDRLQAASAVLNPPSTRTGYVEPPVLPQTVRVQTYCTPSAGGRGVICN